MMSEIKRVRLQIRGRVQGVWYRGSTAREAGHLGLVGWVRNRPDGSVEAVAQGAPAAVEALITWCRRGPPAARVDGVDVEPLEVDGDLAGFVVRRGRE